MTDHGLVTGHWWPGPRPAPVTEVIRRLPPGTVVTTELEARQIRRREVAMPKTDDEYAAALGPCSAGDPSVQALDTAEGEAAKARLEDRVAAFRRRSNRQGGAGPHTGL